MLGPLRIRCYPHSPIASAVIYYGLADQAEMRFLLNYLQPGDGFIDAGANIGVYSLLACSVPGVEVLALEPSSVASRRLAENVALNGLQDRVAVLKEAAGAEVGTARLTVGRDAMNSVTSDAGASSEEVPMTSLDNLMLQRPHGSIALIKIDVEGWELEVLQGATELLRQHRPALIVEVNDPAGLSELAEKIGYRPVVYLPDSNRLTSATGGFSRGANAILVADIAMADERLQESDHAAFSTNYD